MSVPPWLVLAALISLAAALLYQIGTRRYGWRVLAYWLLALCGLLVGETAAESLGLNITRLGDLRLLPDLLGVGLVIAFLWFVGL